MEIPLSFDMGAYSTKVSFFGLGSSAPLTTVEIPSILLYGKNGEKLIGDDALAKIEEEYDHHSNHFITNFAQLIGMDPEMYQSSREHNFTYARAKSRNHDELVYQIGNTEKLVTPEQCLVIFLTKIKQKLTERYFKMENAVFAVQLVVDSTKHFLDRELLARVFKKAGYGAVQFCYKNLALGYLYAKQCNYSIDKDVLFIDIGYSKCTFSLVHIDKTNMTVKEDKVVELGLRDFDLAICDQILIDLKAKYAIDYSKDKNVRFSLLNKINTLKKSFALGGEARLNLANTFGSRYSDQCVTITENSYVKRNADNFGYFNEQLANFLKEMSLKEDICVEDVQIVGGGRKITEFSRLIVRHFDLSEECDKLNAAYAVSKGCLLDKEFKGKVQYSNCKEIRYELIEGVVKDAKDELSDSRSIEANNIADEEELAITDPKGGEADDDKSATGKKNTGDHINTMRAQDKPRADPEGKYADRITADKTTNKIVKYGVLYSIDEYIELNSAVRNVEFESEPDKAYSLHLYYRDMLSTQSVITICRIVIDKPFKKLSINIDKGLKLSSLRLEPSGAEIIPDVNAQIDNQPSILCANDSKCNSGHKSHDIVINLESHSDHNSYESSGSHCHTTNPLINATFLHVLADLIQAVCLLILAVLIFFKPSLAVLDPIISLIVSITIIFLAGRYTIKLFVKLMEATPIELNYNKILNRLTAISYVTEVHDLHLWELGDRKFAGTAHIVTNHDPNKILKEATLVFRKYKVYHTTIQIETPAGKGDSMYINCDNNID